MQLVKVLCGGDRRSKSKSSRDTPLLNHPLISHTHCHSSSMQAFQEILRLNLGVNIERVEEISFIGFPFVQSSGGQIINTFDSILRQSGFELTAHQLQTASRELFCFESQLTELSFTSKMLSVGFYLFQN